MKIKWKALIVNLLIPLAVGGLTALLTRNSMDIYSQITKPALAPPSILFPIVWSILYTLMGISSYLIFVSNHPDSGNALFIYALQLIVNFIWPLVFFNGQMFWIAFAIILLLWVLIIIMIRRFYEIRPIAAYLQIPYLVWVTFAAYLNLMIAILN